MCESLSCPSSYPYLTSTGSQWVWLNIIALYSLVTVQVHIRYSPRTLQQMDVLAPILRIRLPPLRHLLSHDSSVRISSDSQDRPGR